MENKYKLIKDRIYSTLKEKDRVPLQKSNTERQ